MKKLKYPIPVKEYLRTLAQQKALIRLLHVAENAPPHRLHMNAVVDKGAACGTARCLIGWCIVDPILRKTTDFGLVDRGYSDRKFPYAFDVPSDAARTFGITDRQAAMLFLYKLSHIGLRVKKREVVARIKQLLRGMDIMPYPACGYSDCFYGFDNKIIAQ